MSKNVVQPIERYKNGRLTLDGMKAAIDEGGSVSYGGNVITKKTDLPKASELLKDDPEAAKTELAKVQAQLKENQIELAALKDIVTATTPPASTPPSGGNPPPAT